MAIVRSVLFHAVFTCYLECSGQADIALLLDSSSSMGESEWFSVLSQAKQFVQHLNLNASQMRIGVATYADEVDVRFHLNEFTSVQDVLNAISWPFVRGTTNTAQALR